MGGGSMLTRAPRRARVRFPPQDPRIMPEPSAPAAFPPPPPPRPEPPAGRKFPCVQCGARLDFDPRAKSLQCPYCGHSQKIEKGQTEVVERDLEEYLARQA